nr:putative ribonuclease H-like domain-containing protein [Tanacetum cinerariifolium]
MCCLYERKATQSRLTPQQNGIAERKNRTLIEVARTMLVDSLLPILFWAEAINAACYVQNRVLVTKPQYKTPYELLHGRTPSIGFMRPFGCHVTILNTLDSLGKFEGKVDEGFLVEYSVNSKAFRVFNSNGPTWLFDIDSLTRTMNYQPVIARTQSNPSVGDANFDGKEHESTVNLSPSSSSLSGKQDDMTKKKDKGKSPVDYFIGNRDFNKDFNDYSEDSSNDISAAGLIVPTARQNYSNSTNPISVAGPIVPNVGQNYSNSTNPISAVGPIVLTAGQNYSNSTNPISDAGPSNSNTSPIHGNSSFQDASQSLDMLESEDIVYFDRENVGAEANFNNLETSITVSPIPITRIHNAHPISQIISNMSLTTQTKRFEDDNVYKVVMALYGLHQARRAWYETLATYLLENGFHRGQIDQTLFIKKQKGDILLVQIYMDDIIFGATNKDLCKSFEKLMKDKFQMSLMGEITFFLGLQVKQKEDGIFINQDKYVAESLKKFGLTKGKSASTPIDTEKPLLKDPNGEDVDVHIYRSMIGSLMYLTSSRPDIMFA